jgi:hypothetical protein
LCATSEIFILVRFCAGADFDVICDLALCRQSAPKEKIRLAHRRIMLLNHPDNGGSDYVASKINEAKDVLVKDLV